MTEVLGSEAAILVETDNNFQYILEYKLLICKTYKQGVKELKTYLRDAYRLKKKKRQPFYKATRQIAWFGSRH